MEINLSHIGLCVSDVERSLAFYTGVLGFTETAAWEVGQEFGPLMELEDVRLASRFVQRDGHSIELLQFHSPGHLGDGSRREINRLGLTHLCLRVDDVDEVAAAVVAGGGAVVEGTRTTVDVGGGLMADFVYCTDPDGTRIELMRLPG